MSFFGKIWTLRATVLATAGLFSVSCTQVGDRLISEGMSAAARDQIMLVRKEPPSFGYQRLIMQSDDFKGLKLFLAKHGLPDFLAETSNEQRRYLILYYLKARHAFVCHSRVENNREFEFHGPYPITAREFKVLDDFRRDPSRKPTKW